LNYYPVFLDLRRRPCLVVGGGKVAAGKIEGLLRAEAEVTVVSPEATESIREWERQARLRYLARRYRRGDLRGFFIAYAATGDRQVDEEMAEEARTEGVLLNVVDLPVLCDFITPAIVRRGDCVVAVSTGGKSPGFARLVRQRLASLIGPEYGAALEIVGAKRKELRQAYADAERRRGLLSEFMDSPALDLLRRPR
jgi:precorrin-2 dehydrogenase/sirohydrochlorin ferrochelatase